MKREILKRELAKELISLGLGTQIPTIRFFSKKYDTSVATIQSILTEMEEIGAVAIKRHGWMGTYLRDKDLSLLWSISRNGNPLVIAFPLPSTPHSEGLATAVKESLAKSKIETFLIFLRGSRNRLQALRQSRCHAIVVSAFTADIICSQSEALVLELPEQTYVSEHRVFYSKQETNDPSKPLRVAVDPASTDILHLTQLEFDSENVEFIPTTYMLYAKMLNNHEVDAVIWDVDETIGKLSGDISSRKLSDKVQKKIGNRNTQAAFVVLKEDTITPVVLRECINPEEIVQIQKSVISGLRVPEY